MDSDPIPSTSFGDEMDGDTKPLVGKDRAMLSRQAPVELGARIMSPTPAAGDGAPEAGETGTEADLPGPITADGPATKLTHRRTGRTSPRTSLSDQYYGASVEVGPLPAGFETVDGGKKVRTKQSRRLPQWIWFILAKSLGIKVRPGDRPWFGTCMYALTMTFALGFSITHAWFKVYDIVSDDTKETVLRGSVAIVMVLYWCSLGIYSNKLAGRLFMTPKFLDSVRLHSKTIFKISAAGIMVLLGVAEVVINCIASKYIFEDPYCKKVSLNVEVCKVLYVMRVGCSVLTVIWNLLVGIIVLSVCRTHTIGLRRFIRDLEDDGRVYELYRRNMSLQGPIRGRKQDGDDDSTEDENLIMWEEDFSPVEDDNVFPKLMPYHFAQASPCHTPTRKGSRHTSQTSGNTATTGQLPESVSHSNTQVFSTLNCQYFPANPNFPNFTSGALSSQNARTVEAEVLTPSEQARNCPSPSLEKSPNKTPTQNASAEGDTTDLTSEKKAPSVPQHSRPIIIIREGSVATADDSVEPDPSEQQANHHTLIAADPPSFASRSTRSGCESPHQSTRVELGSPRRVPSSMTGATDNSQSVDNLSLGVHMLSTDEILLIYWKLGTRMRSTSLVLQRWLCAVIIYILIWSLTFIVWWVKNEATLLGIAEFIIPILILPIICSAYGEVNFEGNRMLKSICPTQDRMDMLFFMTQNPLQITAFGFAVNYGLIAGALGALMVALCTRLVIDEVNM